MADDTSAEWPPFQPGYKDHFHALGIITALFNDLELLLFGTFKRHLRLRAATAQRIFVLLPNYARLDLIRAELASEKDPDVKDFTEHFLTAYQIIADNRNQLAHSSLYNLDSDDHVVVFGKSSKRKPTEMGYFPLTIADLRRVAEEIQKCCNYCVHLEAWWASKYGKIIVGGKAEKDVYVPFPHKPPLPIPLKAIPRADLG